jgi:lipopolysaccharide/colanic/teichoic acid biosynthesis glycosyltransferase
MLNFTIQSNAKVLSVRPGLTDPASVEYINENELLQKYADPEKAYIEIILPAKLELNLKYLKTAVSGAIFKSWQLPSSAF